MVGIGGGKGVAETRAAAAASETRRLVPWTRLRHTELREPLRTMCAKVCCFFFVVLVPG